MRDNSLPGWDDGLKPLDALGIFYVIFDVVWTLLVMTGLIWLWGNRAIPSVRMRNVPLAICSVLFLHGYGGFYILVYPLKGITSCRLEFWLMCGVLPVGIALFQATNVQLLSVATLQQRFIRDDGTFDEPTPQEIRCPFNKLKCWWTHLSWARQTMFAIAVGMFIEICFSLLAFFGSRKFHSYGLWSEFENPLQCRQGVEWIRDIRDVHCWRLQTTLCIVSGLIALPMWLGSLYSPNLEYRQMNFYWAPPLCIAALERVLKGDSALFLHFAATHDFSGENIMFLNHVRDWKAAWAQSPANLKFQKPNAEEVENYRRHLYNIALEIYVTYVHLFGAEFPVNIESEIYHDLKTVFMPAAMSLMRLPKRKSAQFGVPATPIDIESTVAVFPIQPAADSDVSLRKRTPAQEYEDILYRRYQNIVNMVPRLPPDAVIPDTFNETVYDEAAASVKVLILRNTWPKYVDYQASIREREAKKNIYARFVAFFSRQLPSMVKG
ncbi:predicted protein [Histoplasma mississippiense (nom. inval.)]|uniref:predicted protein n=1 Tax=Ajellomyces capsulatus (strain NAm1 / WU24) TaxID=2059318 RepID=UPI000157C633|nr:predicted protein [Histoplasma mississippiense (nom. inval.)]EDN08602.1 predicted protein [Histoplasma mississippiense (nom. inval.)]